MMTKQRAAAVFHPYTISNRVFAVGLAVLLLAGALVHLTGYDRGLPLYESKDERNYIHEVYALRGLTDDPLWIPGYPPGLLYVNHAAQLVVERVTGKPATACACEIVHGLRLTGIVVNLMAITGMAFVARWFGGNLAGLMVPALWLFNPRILAEAQYAFPQIYEHLFFVAALGCAVLALTRRSATLAVLSTLAGLTAVVFKYPQFPVLGLGVGVALWYLWRQPLARRRWGTVLVMQITLIVACAAWLWFGYDAGRLLDTNHEETNVIASGGGLAQLLMPAVLWLRFTALTTQAALPPTLFLPLIIVGTAVLWRRVDTERRLVLFALISLVLLHTLTLIITLDDDNIGLRQSYTVSSYATLWAVASLLAIVAQVRDVSGRDGILRGGLALILVGWLGLTVPRGIDYALERRLPVTFAELPVWAGQMLPFTGDAAIAVSDNRPFIGEWSCYNGPHHPAPRYNPLVTYPLDQWVNEGVAFVQVDGGILAELDAAGLTDDYLPNMTPIATFPADDTTARTWRRGRDDFDLTVYHTLPIEHEADVVYGEQVRLVGYTQRGVLSPGGALVLWLYWQPTATVKADYAAFVHLTQEGQATPIFAQGDGPLHSNPFTPTTAWTEPNPLVDQKLFPGRFVVLLPPELVPGTYRLNVGIYDRANGARLTLADGTDHLAVPLTVR